MIFVQNREISRPFFFLGNPAFMESVSPPSNSVSAYVRLYEVVFYINHFRNPNLSASQTVAESLTSIGIMTISEMNDIRMNRPYPL